MNLKELTDTLGAVVREFVTEPNHVKVEASTLGVIHDIRITPHNDDVGRVIGAKGARWKALAAVCYAFSLKNDCRVELLKISDALGPKRDNYPQFEEQIDYPREKIRSLALRLARVCFKDEDKIDVDLTDSGPETTLIVNVAASERFGAVKALTTAFYCLFEAIGLCHGRKIRTAIVPEVVDQPETAGGRHAPA